MYAVRGCLETAPLRRDGSRRFLDRNFPSSTPPRGDYWRESARTSDRVAIHGTVGQLMQESLGPFQEPSSTISLREYGDVLRRRRAIILQTFVIVLVAGVLVTLFTPPTYQAKARLLIEAPQYTINQVSTDPLADLFRINQQYSLLTQVEMLQTQEMKKKVATKLNAQNLPALGVNGIEGTQIIEITAEGDNPEMVMAAPNTLLELYIEKVKDAGSKNLNEALAFAEERRDQARRELDQIEREMSRFKANSRIVEIAKDKEIVMSRVRELTAGYAEAQTMLNVTKARLAQIESALSNLKPTRSGNVTEWMDPRIQGIDDQLAVLEVQRKALEVEYNPDYNKKGAKKGDLFIPAFERINRQQEQLLKRRKELVDSLDKRNMVVDPVYASLSPERQKLSLDAVAQARQVADLGTQLNQERARLQSFPAYEQTWGALTRRYADSDTAWKYFASKVGDLQLRKQTTDKSNRITTLQPAEIPTQPIRPKKAQNIVFAGLLGLFFGLCLALLQELFDDRINSPEEAERVLRLPSLGQIPMIEEEGLRLIKDISTFSPLMESYRSLRTNINFAAVGNPVRSIVITSSVPAEGKSTTVANLAMAMALENKRVIIVDADLRRPSQHKLFKVDSTPGLTDILVGTHSIDEVMQHTSVDNVKIIPAGSPPPNPAELLGSAAMGHLLATLEAQADIILFDSPPALAVADSVVLASRAGGVLLVVGYGETKKANTKKALEVLSRATANVLGTVLNRMDGPSSGYYYGKYYVPATERPTSGAVATAADSNRALPGGDSGSSRLDDKEDTQ
jgi:polysaccharide biosynthesis transport protein